MPASEATRFFDTSGCLNLSRPTSGQTRNVPAKQLKRPMTSSAPIRGQVKIDLYNFDHSDFVDSKYVLTSPRSLQACARLNIKPAELLPKKLSDLTASNVRYSTIVDVRDEMEVDRLAKLQRCREEREKIIREKTIEKLAPNPRPQSQSQIRQPKTQLPPRPTIGHSILKPTVAQWPSSNDERETRPASSNSFLDDVRRMDKSLQRIGTSKTNQTERYVNGLENVKHIIEYRATTNHDSENEALEKKQYELLLSHYDHELKIQKARENARRTEKEKDAERYETMMHDFLDQTMADERRQNELRRKLDKLHQSRQLYEALQAKNHEIQMTDAQKRRAELLNEIKRKDRRAEHFIKDKQDTVKLSRALAKSSQDTRTYVRETRENFDEKAKRAELATNILVTKPKMPVDRRYVQSTLQA